MSLEEYQRAMADLMRAPALCGAVRRGDEALAGYTLTALEQGRLRAIASHHGMVVNAMLYRAGRLVGITRRLPATVSLLGPALREVFDAYLLACPDASAEFDREAQAFAAFVAARLDDPAGGLAQVAEPLRAALAAEAAALSRCKPA